MHRLGCYQTIVGKRVKSFRRQYRKATGGDYDQGFFWLIIEPNPFLIDGTQRTIFERKEEKCKKI